MCFSPEVSFGLSATLLPAGAYCVWIAMERNKALLGLAIIPIVFGIQQFFEALVWTGMGQENLDLAQGAALFFLYFALAFWPFWIPMCAFFPEPEVRKKRFLGFFAVLGLVVGLVLYLPVLLNPEVLQLRVRHHSMVYDVTRSAAFQVMGRTGWQVLYIVIVGTPMLIAPLRGFVFLGVALVVAAAASHVFFWYAFTSVWCFFAAMLSLYLCFSFRRLPLAA